MFKVKPGVFRHVTCRNNIYPKSNVYRQLVPDELVYWSSSFPSYCPPAYTASHIQGQVWADPLMDDYNFKPKWNELDNNVNRKSWTGEYKIKDGYPENAFGRTGITGRGLLGRWGPNHAADPIVTRWKKNTGNEETEKNVLQIVVIQRNDNKMWALPGGMVDPGENVSDTVKREFIEEAVGLNSEYCKIIEEFFQIKQVEIYKGYVDDFRNTDNAWMETVAYNFHDDNGKYLNNIKLSAGDDAIGVRWVDVNKNLILHANHIDLVEVVAKKLNAFW